MLEPVVLKRCAAVALPLLAVAATAAAVRTRTSLQQQPPFVQAASDVEAGRYLVLVGGCNDCHTEGWGMRDIPEAEQLTGNHVGYRGPWGTTYAANLRGMASRVTEDQWVNILKTAANGHGRPPMPWGNIRQMNERDLRNIYRYVHSLGAAGDRMPRGLPPGVEPSTMFVDFMPQQGHGPPPPPMPARGGQPGGAPPAGAPPSGR